MAMLGEITRFMIEQNGVTFDISGYVTSYEISSHMDGMLEASFNIIGDGVRVLLDTPEVETARKLEPLNDFKHIREIRRCGYCKQLNDETQLSCGHCGGDL